MTNFLTGELSYLYNYVDNVKPSFRQLSVLGDLILPRVNWLTFSSTSARDLTAFNLKPLSLNVCK